MTEVQNLGALEQRAEKALEKAETGWREFAQAMREIKDSEAHTEAGYRYFQPYYRERWEPRTKRGFSNLTNVLYGLVSVEEMEAVAAPLHEVDIGYNEAGLLRGQIKDPLERLEVWQDFRESGKPLTADRAALRQHIAEHKGEGVIERLEDAGVEIPPYPEGPSDEEVAYRKFSDLAAVAKDVTPEAAARAVSSSTAYSVAHNYDFLLPWVRGFLAELHIRAGR